VLAVIHADANIAIRSAVGLVFLSAAAGKLRHLSIFPGVVANYRLLPPVLVPPVAYLLPVVEGIVGAALLARAGSPAAEICAISLLLTFAIAMSVNLRRGRRHIDCGCFQGALRQPLCWPLVARNGVMALLLGAAAGPVAADPWTLFNGLMAGLALFLAVQCLNALWAIGPPIPRPAGHTHARMEGM
jgi:hypothetical protein